MIGSKCAMNAIFPDKFFDSGQHICSAIFTPFAIIYFDSINHFL